MVNFIVQYGICKLQTGQYIVAITKTKALKMSKPARSGGGQRKLPIMQFKMGVAF